MQKNKNLTAGEVVTNKKMKSFLYIEKIWDLPKGKMDNGDNQRYCTKEVMEETGIDSLKIIDFKMITYHIFKR